MRSYKKESTKKSKGPCISHCYCGYDSSPNDIGPENEGDEGYLSPDSDSDSELVGSHKQGPTLSAFLMRARHLLACVDVSANRVKAICAFFIFILKPVYAPFHRANDKWRTVVHKKCDEFLAETTDATLRTLCDRFKMEFPVGGA
jgi:hypothetical protein